MSAPKVTFYDVPPDGRWPLVAKLVEAAWRKGRKILVHCGDVDEARALDDFLWTFKDEAFVPHELANDPGELTDTDARVVVVTAEARPIAATILLQLTPASRAFAETFEHVLEIIDHRSPERLAAGRERYKAWRDAGVDPAYRKG